MQPPVVLGDHGDSSRVDGVALAGMSGVEQPGPRGQLRGHVHDGFVGGGQALGDAAAESGGAFDRPLPWRPLLGPGPQQGDSVAVDLKPDRGADLAAGLHGDRSEGAFMGVDPDGDHALPSVAGDGEPRDGQPDLKSDHASVEPRRGRATAGGSYV